jgi:6-phosphogluconolactonase
MRGGQLARERDENPGHWRGGRRIGDNLVAMKKLSRREFMMTASAATLAVSASPALSAARTTRVFVGSNTPDGILAFDWDGLTGELKSAGVAAKLANVDWITYAPGREFLYAASEVDSFNGKPTGEVASYRVVNGELRQISAANSASKGTCHIALDRTGRVLLEADYGGGSAGSFLIQDGRLSQLAWSEHYTEHGPNASRQEGAHAHFASFSPDNSFAYINDLGGDCIHIYRLDAATARLTAAGSFRADPGAGPRTLHFHPNGVTAYLVNEMGSSVCVLAWNKADGSLSRTAHFELLEKGEDHTISTGCDTVISRDGRSVYFAHRGIDFLSQFKADGKSGALTPVGRTSCGGKTPRNFVLDPTESWMLVANQGSSQISVFRRDKVTGALAGEGKSYAAPAPMCILFG